MRIIAIGKKHEKWVSSGIELFEKRLKKPFDLKWDILPHSNFAEEKAREEETQRIMRNARNESFTTLLKLATDREDPVKAFVIERTPAIRRKSERSTNHTTLNPQ